MQALLQSGPGVVQLGLVSTVARKQHLVAGISTISLCDVVAYAVQSGACFQDACFQGILEGDDVKDGSYM